MARRLEECDLVSGSRYLKVFDPDGAPPEDRRQINMEVTRWINDCLGLNITDAFCGFKAYRRQAIESFQIADTGYAMPLEVWVEVARNRLRLVEEPVPLIYLDASRAFGGSLDDPSHRLEHYRRVFRTAMRRAGLVPTQGCA
jgi:hypothetical protein